MKADGKLDKFGRPNDATPAKWVEGYKDYSASATAPTASSAPSAPVVETAPTVTATSAPDVADDGDAKKKRRKHEGESSEEKYVSHPMNCALPERPLLTPLEGRSASAGRRKRRQPRQPKWQRLAVATATEWVHGKAAPRTGTAVSQITCRGRWQMVYPSVVQYKRLRWMGKGVVLYTTARCPQDPRFRRVICYLAHRYKASQTRCRFVAVTARPHI